MRTPQKRQDPPPPVPPVPTPLYKDEDEDGDDDCSHDDDDDDDEDDDDDDECSQDEDDDSRSQHREDAGGHGRHGHQHYARGSSSTRRRGGNRSSRNSNSERTRQPLVGETYTCGRCNTEHLPEPLVWALRRTAVHEFLRPGPCLDSPRIGWDGLDVERLPPPVDQAGPRPGPGQRGAGRDESGGGLQPLSSSHEQRRGTGAAAAAAGAAIAAGDGATQAAVGSGSGATAPGITTMFRIARRGLGGGGSTSDGSGNVGIRGSGSGAATEWASTAVYRVAAAEGIRVRRGADPQSAEVTVLGEGAELVVAEEVHDGNGGVWMRLLAPVQGWIGRRGNSLVALSRGSPRSSSANGSRGGVEGGGWGEGDGSETGEAAEVALAKDLEDCMEEEAGTELYRRGDRLFGSRQGWSLPSGGGSGLGTASGGGRREAGSGPDSRVPGERRATVVGHASVSGCWAAVASMSTSAAKEKLAATAATLAVLHCRKILLTVLLQCHKEVMRTASGGQASADALLSQRMAALVGARDSTSLPLSSRVSGAVVKSGGEPTPSRATPTISRTRAASRQFSSFLQLVLFRGWCPSWWPSADGAFSEDNDAGELGAEGEEDAYVCFDDKEPMSDCFRSLPVVLTPLVLSLLRAAAAQRAASSREVADTGGPTSSGGVRGSLPPRSQSFGAQVEEAILQSVASQLRQATRIGHRDHAWASSDAAEMSDAHCLRYPRLRYVTWAARVVQAGSGAPAVPRRIFHAWAVGLRSPSLLVKQQVCSELSRLLDESVQMVDRAYRDSAPAAILTRDAGAEDAAGAGDGASDVVVDAAKALQRETATRRLRQCVKLLPLERLRSLAERRMLKEGEDEPMLSRALQSIVDLVASADLALRVLHERKVEEEGGEEDCGQKGDDGAATTVASTTATKTEPSVGTETDGDVHYPTGRDESDENETARAVLCFPSPSAYVALQGRDLEPPWTAEFWVLRPNPDGTWEDGQGEVETIPEGGGGDNESREEQCCVIRPLDLPLPAPKRGIRKSYSERLPATVVPLPSISRAISTPSSSVDLSQLPPVDPEKGAPTLFRARSVDAVGHNEAASEALNPDEFPLLPSIHCDQANEGDFPPRSGGEEKPSRRSDSSWGRTPSSGTAGPKARHSPWDQRINAGGGAEGGGRRRGSIYDGDAATPAEDKAVLKGEIGTEPAEYLASSQAGHIRIQAGGTVFSSSVGQFSGEGDGDGKDKNQEGEGGEERLVHSEALCVSMGAAGEKERAFDFVVPTGRWVHLAIVASSPPDPKTTLYVDGVAVDTMSLRMSLPMGWLGAGPHAQEASAAATGGGSFVGLLAQTR